MLLATVQVSLFLHATSDVCDLNDPRLQYISFQLEVNLIWSRVEFQEYGWVEDGICSWTSHFFNLVDLVEALNDVGGERLPLDVSILMTLQGYYAQPV